MLNFDENKQVRNSFIIRILNVLFQDSITLLDNAMLVTIDGKEE
jgi:hypothetical protein